MDPRIRGPLRVSLDQLLRRVHRLGMLPVDVIKVDIRPHDRRALARDGAEADICNTKYIILNSSFISFNTNFIILNAKFIILNAKFTFEVHGGRVHGGAHLRVVPTVIIVVHLGAVEYMFVIFNAEFIIVNAKLFFLNTNLLVVGGKATLLRLACLCVVHGRLREPCSTATALPDVV